MGVCVSCGECTRFSKFLGVFAILCIISSVCCVQKHSLIGHISGFEPTFANITWILLDFLFEALKITLLYNLMAVYPKNDTS